MILAHVIFREILCRAAERKIRAPRVLAVLMRYAGTMLIITHTEQVKSPENRR